MWRLDLLRSLRVTFDWLGDLREQMCTGTGTVVLPITRLMLARTCCVCDRG